MKLSKVISILLHPVFMPIIAVHLSLLLIPAIGFAITNYLRFIYLVLILSTIIMPLLSVFLLIKIKLVSSLEISDHKERPTTLLITGIWMLAGYLMLEEILVFTPLIKVELLGAIIIIFLASIISKYWKISLHMIGIGAVVGVLILLNLLFGEITLIIAVSVLVAGFLGAARLNENAHNHAQVYCGFLLGLFVELSLGLLLF